MSDTATIGLLGLATSHPLADIANLRQLLPSAQFRLFTGKDPELDRFFTDRVKEAHPDLIECPRWEDFLAGLDAVILTARPSQVPAALERLTVHPLPLYVNKPLAVSTEQIDGCAQALAGYGAPVMSGSVLPHALQWRELLTRLQPPATASEQCWMFDGEPLQQIRMALRHDLQHWNSGDRAWQQERLVGGGLVGTIGIHGFDLLTSIFGKELSVVTAGSQSADRSPDPAIVHIELRAGGDVPVSLMLVGVAPDEQYRVELLTPAEVHEVNFTHDPTTDSLGFLAAMSAFLDLTGETSHPATWGMAMVEDLLQAPRLIAASNSALE